MEPVTPFLFESTHGGGDSQGLSLLGTDASHSVVLRLMKAAVRA